ncbi:MAG: hypothetical protein LBI79_07650 [Nitrososphaerota archaeon]|jgi:hypothetical protein|nr:hypothetical protein [Nitrososphaerota archaeon]
MTNNPNITIKITKKGIIVIVIAALLTASLLAYETTQPTNNIPTTATQPQENSPDQPQHPPQENNKQTPQTPTTITNG